MKGYTVSFTKLTKKKKKIILPDPTTGELTGIQQLKIIFNSAKISNSRNNLIYILETICNILRIKEV